MLKLIVDENIVFAEQAFSAFGDIQLFPGRQLSNQILQDADILIVRSVTKVDERLLKNTKIKFVGTATTGNDHVDKEYLKKINIFFADAKGCNADSVTEYVFTALMKIVSKNNITLKNKTFGVIGVGNIGGRVARLAESLGMRVLKNDPPLQRAGDKSGFVSVDEALQADIISLHVPLTIDGSDKTYHLLNADNLKRLKNNSILINTSRGEVIDNKALLEIAQSKNLKLVLDVWENEPDISRELLKFTEVGTAHIAGYSYEGKINGTRIIFEALCKFISKELKWSADIPLVESHIRALNTAGNIENNLFMLLKSIYNIDEDDSGLKYILKMDNAKTANHFDRLRKEYKVRREFSNYTVQLNEDKPDLQKFLKQFRFKVKIG